jgi:hypothetical protein
MVRSTIRDLPSAAAPGADGEHAGDQVKLDICHVGAGVDRRGAETGRVDVKCEAEPGLE